jgi:flagellar biosynthetic protein FliO
MAAIMTNLKKWFENSSKKQKLFASLLAVSLLITGVLLSLGGTSNVAADPLNSTPFYFLSAFVKLIAVLLLIVGSSVILRRWQQVGPNGKVAQQMRLLETIRLSPKQSLHLVLIGDQKLLVGATDQNVSLISAIENNPDSISIEESQPQSGMDFGSMLRSFNFSSENIQGKE